MARGRHAPKTHARTAFIVAVVAGFLLLVLGGGAWAAYRYEQSHADRILPGVKIAGVDVGGMNRREATTAVRALADRALTTRLTLTAGDSHYIVTPAELGKRADIKAAVGEALAVGDDMGTFARFWHRFREESVGVSVDLAYQVQGRGIDALVKQIAADVAVEPRDATIRLNGDLTDVRFVHSKDGQKLPTTPAIAAIQSALGDGLDTVDLRLQSVHPKVTDRSLGATIVVRVDQNRLYLYDGFKVEQTYDVATAKPGYTTPAGVWNIWDKRVDPTWYNPALDSWGAGLPAVIPGGPSNPMGPRAIYIDAPGLIRIHGTTDDSSIGRYASHGCIRMHNTDVIDLFDRIEIGQHVLVAGARPASAGYWSVPPASDI